MTSKQAKARWELSMAQRHAAAAMQRAADGNIETAKKLVIMADDLRHISSLQKGGDPWALDFAQRLERKATALLERTLTDEGSD